MRTVVAALPLAVLLACSSPTAVELGHSVTLAPGQSARVAGYDVVVTFVGVPEDSRCPVGELILCVWEGDARVVLRLEGLAGGEDMNIHTHVDFGQTAIYGPVSFQLAALTPEPTGDGPPKADAYRLTLSVSGALD